MIRANAARYPISARCGIPDVPRSTYCWMTGHPGTERADPIAGDVRAVRCDGRERHGARKIKAALERRGVTASRRRIGGIMREQGMTGAYARGRSEPHRTRADEAGLANLPDPRVRRLRPAHAAPHTHLASDLTYVRVGGDWAYVCLLDGLADRGIVGHSAGRTRDASLVLGAFATLDFPLTDVQETGVCRPEGSAGPSSRILTLGDNSMQADRVREMERINDAFLEEVVPFAVHDATIVDARGMTKNGWLVSDGRSIVERDAPKRTSKRPAGWSTSSKIILLTLTEW